MGRARNVRCLVAYRGTDFRGFAENDGVHTVGGVLRRAIEQVLRAPVELTVAGRTDAGVHATGQVISFRTSSDQFDAGRLERSLNALCAPDVVVRDLVEVDEGFDARFSATERHYEYTVNNGSHPDPLRASLEWHVRDALDLGAMNDAAAQLVGEHDFSSFCRRPKDRPHASLVRDVRAAEWRRLGDDRFVFTVRAKAFCQQMVRSLVGVCVSVGVGRQRAEDVQRILAVRDRGLAPPIAPPEGLVLVHVSYDTSGASPGSA
jgi:tRNA pseudouridine38-40 synthase